MGPLIDQGAVDDYLAALEKVKTEGGKILYGGEVIHHFSFAMIIGVLVGTYSSVFVASSILVRMHPEQ